MNPTMELALVVLAAILIFELAAARWGYDSRDNFRVGPYQD
jgi:hypothetical protein